MDILNFKSYILESLAEIIFFATANFLVFFCFPMIEMITSSSQDEIR
jgi:hypothetical protein